MDGALADKRILVIEDDAYNLAIMSAVLRRSGAKVYFERWGDDVEERLKKLTPLDLVLLDLNLPTIDGFQVYAIIRAIPDMIAVPVVAVSASDDSAVVNRIRDVGMQGFIAKPLNSRTFPQYIEKALAGEEVWIRR